LIRCAKTLVSTDDENYNISQVEYMGKVVNAESLHVYGVCSNPPADSLGILFNVQNEDNHVVIFSKQPERFKGLVEYEVQVGNFKTKSSMKFADSGNVEIDAQSGKFIIKNNDEELITWLEEFVIGIEAMTTSTSLGPQPPINLATFTALKTRIAKLKGV